MAATGHYRNSNRKLFLGWYVHDETAIVIWSMSINRNYIVPIAIIAIIFLLRHIREQNRNMGCDFRGIVQNVVYTDGYTEVAIKDHVYILDNNYNVQHLIKKGDFLIKRRGSTIYRLVKYEHPRVFTFDNQTAMLP